MALATLMPTVLDTMTTRSTTHSAHSCPSCGYHYEDFPDPMRHAGEAQKRIRELESQVRLLHQKAATAADKLADYEDELNGLRDANAKAQQQGHTSRPSLEGPGPAITPGFPQPQQPSRLASLSSLLPGRRKDPSMSNLPVTPASGAFPPNINADQGTTLSPPSFFFGLGSAANSSAPALHSTHSDSQLVTLSTLQSSLEAERTLRQKAETSLTEAQSELEELTAQLFGQANEMVATERKARAKLEERVKILEQRDVEKRKRLDRLEKALMRIERVRGMVGP